MFIFFNELIKALQNTLDDCNSITIGVTLRDTKTQYYTMYISNITEYRILSTP